MKEAALFKHQIQQIDPIKRFNRHSVISISLISKIEKDLTKKYASEDYAIENYTKLFKDIKQSYKVLQLIIEELQSDLKIANLEFTIEPFKKINIFMINITNLILDGFSNIYTLFQQKLMEQQFYKSLEKSSQKKITQTFGITDETEINQLKKRHYEYKEKLNYFLNSTEQTEQDFNYMQQLKKILQNKQIGERYKIPTTSHEILIIKQKMQQIIQFADLISSENTKIRTQQFINIDLFKLNKASIQALTINILKKFQNAFKYKYIKNIQNTSRQFAKQINYQYKQKLISIGTQTLQNFGTKKTNQAQQLLKQIQLKAITLKQLKQNLQINDKQLQQYKSKLILHDEQKRQNQQKIYRIQKNYEILQKEYSKYRSTSQFTFKQLKQLMQIKNKKIESYKSEVQNLRKIFIGQKIFVDQSTNCQNLNVEGNKSIETQTQIMYDSYIGLCIQKQKQQCLSKINVLKQKKINRLQILILRLKQCLKNDLLGMNIEVIDEDTQQYLNMIQNIINNKLLIQNQITQNIIKKTQPHQIQQLQNKIKQDKQLEKKISKFQFNQKLIKNKINKPKNLKNVRNSQNITHKYQRISKLNYNQTSNILKLNQINTNTKHSRRHTNLELPQNSIIQVLQFQKTKNNIDIKILQYSKNKNSQVQIINKNCQTQTDVKQKFIKMASFSCQVNIPQYEKDKNQKFLLNQQTNRRLSTKRIKTSQQHLMIEMQKTYKKKPVIKSKSKQNLKHIKLQSFENLPQFTLAESNRSKLIPIKIQSKQQNLNKRAVIIQNSPNKFGELFRIQKLKTQPQEQIRNSRLQYCINEGIEQMKRQYYSEYKKLIKYLSGLQGIESIMDEEIQKYDYKSIINSLTSKFENHYICQQILHKIKKVNRKNKHRKSNQIIFPIFQ